MIEYKGSNMTILRRLEYGSVVALGLLILTLFRNRHKNRQLSTLQSLIYTVRSSTFRNILLSAGSVALLSKYLFGTKTRRSFPVFFLTIWAIIYNYRVVETPKVWFHRTYWNTHIVEKARIAQTEFRPVYWAFNRHAQTITCYLISAIEWLWSDPIVYSREEIHCFDGINTQYIDYANFEDSDHSADTDIGSISLSSNQYGKDTSLPLPIVLCIHGLGDTREIPYIKRFARMCLKVGWRVAVWSYWRFDFEESRDLHLVIEHLQRSNPGSPVIAVAWSAGGYSLIRYLEKIGADTPLICAICQSPCLDFVQAVKDVTENENQTYPLFLRGQSIIGIYRHLDNDKRIKEPIRSRIHQVMREESDPMKLYDKFLCSLPSDKGIDRSGLGHEGFLSIGKTIQERVRTASHYNHKACDNFHKIKVTTLLLHAEDDPVVSFNHVDWQKIKSNRHIIVGHTRRGGHCAWHEGLIPFGNTWGDRVTIQFISTVLESHSQTHFIIDLVRAAMANQSMNREALLPNDKLPKLSPQAMARIVSASDLRSMGR